MVGDLTMFCSGSHHTHTHVFHDPKKYKDYTHREKLDGDWNTSPSSTSGQVKVVRQFGLLGTSGIHVYTCVHMWTYTCIYIHTYACMHMRVHMQKCNTDSLFPGI